MVEAEPGVAPCRQPRVELLQLGHRHPIAQLQARVVVDGDVVLPTVGGEEQGLVGGELAGVDAIDEGSAAPAVASKMTNFAYQPPKIGMPARENRKADITTVSPGAYWKRPPKLDSSADFVLRATMRMTPNAPSVIAP